MNNDFEKSSMWALTRFDPKINPLDTRIGEVLLASEKGVRIKACELQWTSPSERKKLLMEFADLLDSRALRASQSRNVSVTPFEKFEKAQEWFSARGPISFNEKKIHKVPVMNHIHHIMVRSQLIADLIHILELVQDKDSNELDRLKLVKTLTLPPPAPTHQLTQNKESVLQQWENRQTEGRINKRKKSSNNRLVLKKLTFQSVSNMHEGTEIIYLPFEMPVEIGGNVDITNIVLLARNYLNIFISFLLKDLTPVLISDGEKTKLIDRIDSDWHALLIALQSLITNDVEIRRCEVCGQLISHLNKGAKTCGDLCKKTRQRS